MLTVEWWAVDRVAQGHRLRGAFSDNVCHAIMARHATATTTENDATAASKPVVLATSPSVMTAALTPRKMVRKYDDITFAAVRRPSGADLARAR